MSGAEGMNEKKIRTLDLFLALIVTASGALFFLFVMRSIEGVAYSTWIVPMVMATIFVAFLSVFVVTVGVKKMIMPITFIAFLPSIIFTPTLVHISITVMMMILAIHGLHIMRRTLFNTLKIDMTTIVRSGISYVSIAIIVVVTSQYYFSLKDNMASMVFDMDEHLQLSNIATDFILSQSRIKDISVNTMTVNDFLYFVVQNAYSEDTQSPHVPVENEGMIIRWAGNMGIALEKVQESAEDQAVAQLRDNLASMIDHEITGNEMVSDIFAQIIEIQVNNAMTQNQILRDNRVAIFTIMFFLVIFSFASIVRIVSNWLARFIFMFLREFKVIHVSKMQREAEIIEM